MTKVQSGVKEVGLYINGKYVNSSNDETFKVTNPATQETIAYVSEATEQDIDKACRAARDAFENGPWRTMTVAERCAKLRRMAEIILERKEEIARLDATDVGKPYLASMQHEVPRAA